MMVLFILLFVVIWLFDLHKNIYVKSISRNAGDSAALIAGRWQGMTLNLIGDLNIMHAIALSAEDSATAEAIVNMQARLCYAGPMVALMAAQQAAKNNGLYVNPDFSTLMSEHAYEVAHDYPSQSNPEGEPLFPEPYTNCWKEYSEMLYLVARDGVVAGPDNERRYADFAGGHFLLMSEFYDAISQGISGYWCWFYRHAPNLPAAYTDYTYWPPLPKPPNEMYMNSEIFGLGLNISITSISAEPGKDFFTASAAERQPSGVLNDKGMNTNAIWYSYGSGWSPWTIMHDTTFPMTGSLKPQYDYVGADAAIRVEASFARLSPLSKNLSQTNTITWTAAAKPFGYLEPDQAPNTYQLVLPAFRAVRLIPMDASTASAAGSYNLAWRRHIDNNLTNYLENGLNGLDPACYYCQMLLRWEDPELRQSGVAWLSTNTWQCTIPGGTSGSRGGGTRRGH